MAFLRRAMAAAAAAGGATASAAKIRSMQSNRAAAEPPGSSSPQHTSQNAPEYPPHIPPPSISIANSQLDPARRRFLRFLTPSRPPTPRFRGPVVPRCALEPRPSIVCAPHLAGARKLAEPCTAFSPAHRRHAGRNARCRAVLTTDSTLLASCLHSAIVQGGADRAGRPGCQVVHRRVPAKQAAPGLGARVGGQGRWRCAAHDQRSLEPTLPPCPRIAGVFLLQAQSVRLQHR